METIFSESKNFKVEIYPLETIDKIYKSNIKVMDKNNKIIHEYIQKYATSPLNQFVTINGQEWWIGGREYMLKLFVNCETGQVFDDPDKRELSNSFKSGSEFIWRGDVKISPKGNYLMVVGCTWAFPYEWRLYDISNMIKNVTNNMPDPDEDADEEDVFMIREISLYKHLRDKTEIQEDDPRYEASKNPLYDDEVFTYEFVSDNEITIKYIDVKEWKWKYYNTIDLVAYE